MTSSPWGTGTGLDRLRTLAEDLPDHDYVPYSHLGLTLTAVEKGRVELLWTPDEKVLNRGGVVHGGYIATALDEACGLAATGASVPSTPYLTMSLNLDYVRPLSAGATYTVIASVQRSGAIRTLTRAEVLDSAGRLCAQATSALTPNRVLLFEAEQARAMDQAD